MGRSRRWPKASAPGEEPVKTYGLCPNSRAYLMRKVIRGHQRPSEAIKPPEFESILIDDSLDGLARPHMTQHGHSTA